MKKLLLALAITTTILSCSNEKTEETKNEEVKNPLKTTTDEFQYVDEEFNKDDYALDALLSTEEIIIDGKPNDPSWEKATWYPLNHRWLGKPFTKEDFTGRYKLAWNTNKLFLLVEITDDLIIDKEEVWNKGWWNDDCVEIFIDEDNGDDLHQFNHKAFAYHVALNTKDVVDLGTDSLPHRYNHHLVAAKSMKNDKNITWEFAINIYSDNYKDGEQNEALTLSSGKEMGFALAYCDSDTSKSRENFIGSIPMKGKNNEERDQGWKDAGVFNTLTLK